METNFTALDYTTNATTTSLNASSSYTTGGIETFSSLDGFITDSCNMTPSGSTNWDLLLAIEEKKTNMLISTLIYMSVLMGLGFLGNTLVIVVYTVRIQKGTTRIFILALAVADILNNMLGMSGEIIDITQHFTFTSSVMCRFIRFNNYITVFSSIFILIAVAIDRYRRVCRPHSKQITVCGAKAMVAFAVFFASLITVPALILNGVREFVLEEYCIEAYECTFMNAWNDTPYPHIFIGTQFLMFVASCCIVLILYILIGRTIFIHSRFSFRDSFLRKKKNKVEIAQIVPLAANPVSYAAASRIAEPNDSASDAPSGYGESEADALNIARKSILITRKRKIQKSRKIKNRTTLMLVAISLVFILSCLPYLSISVMKRLDSEYVSSLTEFQLKVHNIFLRSYFINSAANPIIYSFFNARFRTEVMGLFCPSRY
ncbi:hypothetical protein LOTGIDRAFT_171870 [Lottia gigantea]|uniref:G-protein coupled receptors family 1 profile domain-containing protein n=1 Tax=Lottia gigantea TaxID=225164 RepID=V4CKA4_LOTGI|nr:hypothetical protein LOTGIDRAFT_171870 [Lottia gigantea]ESP02670.1 hypothetical protein LOTGIDRAFT_171870 [Lottia gigantea]